MKPHRHLHNYDMPLTVSLLLLLNFIQHLKTRARSGGASCMSAAGGSDPRQHLSCVRRGNFAKCQGPHLASKTRPSTKTSVSLVTRHILSPRSVCLALHLSYIIIYFLTSSVVFFSITRRVKQVSDRAGAILHVVKFTCKH